MALAVLFAASTVSAEGSSRSDLEQAIVQGDSAAVQQILAHDPAASRSGAPLLLALEQPTPDYETVRLLISNGADVNARDRRNNSALLLAVLRSEKKIVSLLLRRGADPNARDSRGETPLAKAVFFGREDIADLLIRRGAKLDQFQAAALGMDRWLRRYLVEHPKALNARDRGGYTILDWAAIRRQSRTVALILAMEPALDLFNAAAAGETAFLRDQLQKAPGLVNMTDSHGLTPLKWAVVGGQTEAVKLLIQHNADPNIGHPIFEAVRKGDVEIVKLLISARADTQYLEPGIGTPYALAQREGKHEIADLLRPR